MYQTVKKWTDHSVHNLSSTVPYRKFKSGLLKCNPATVSRSKPW